MRRYILRVSEILHIPFRAGTESTRSKLVELKEHANDLYRGPFLLRCFHSQRDADVIADLRSGVVKAIQYFNVRLSTIPGFHSL